jgi:hypothetical protein
VGETKLKRRGHAKPHQQIIHRDHGSITDPFCQAMRYHKSHHRSIRPYNAPSTGPCPSSEGEESWASLGVCLLARWRRSSETPAAAIQHSSASRISIMTVRRILRQGLKGLSATQPCIRQLQDKDLCHYIKLDDDNV